MNRNKTPMFCIGITKLNRLLRTKLNRLLRTNKTEQTNGILISYGHHGAYPPWGNAPGGALWIDRSLHLVGDQK
jgi:hypothetical protein